jgi:translocator protein
MSFEKTVKTVIGSQSAMMTNGVKIGAAPKGVGFRLEAAQFLPQPINRVFELFSDAFQLEKLTPEWLEFSVTTPAPIRIAAGTLLLFVALCFSAAGIGGAITSSSVGTWYQTLLKPRWTPPDWVFGPVWTALYLMMAVSAYLVCYRSGWFAARVALFWFGLQLVLNVCWSALFFGFRSPGLALLDIVLLWASIVATAVQFRRHLPAAAALLVPYLLWASFAAVLNFAIWRMNS